jgi:hypothetical protein
MTRHADPRRSVLPLVFAASFASLAYELALIRLLSITLWYHFAFMVVSIAMLGIGASGTLLSVMPRLKDVRHVPAYVILLAVAIPASYLAAGRIPFDPARLSWDWMQLVFIGLFAIVLSVPFLFFGLAVSASYASLTGSAGAVYAADLLGAGAGSVALFGLLYTGGPERTIFIMSLLAAGAAFLRGGTAVRSASAFLVCLDLLLLLAQPAFIRPVMSAYKPLPFALTYPGAKVLETRHSPYSRIDVFDSPAVRFAPGLSFAELDPLPPQTGIAVDGGDIHAITHAGDPSRMKFIDHLPSALPYLLGRPRDVLVLEPKGGLSLHQAIRSGATRIVSVESNPLLQEIVDERAGITPPPGVELLSMTGLGRSRISGQDRRFDVISMSLLSSLLPGAFGLSEDYSATVEAFQRYLERLAPGGLLSLDLYLLPPARSELRLLATVLEAAEETGTVDAADRIAVVRSWDTITIMYKNGSLTPSDVAAVRRFCDGNRFDTVFYPGMQPGEGNRYVRMRDNSYANAFRSIIDRETRSAFIRDHLFDIRPKRDAAPFAHYYLKLENIAEIYRAMGGKWQYFFEEGYLLPLLLLQVLVVSIVVMLLPLVRRRPLVRAAPRRPIGTLPYFGALGLGYLFVEVSFMQLMMLPLEHPAYAAGTVVASVLAGSGLGGYLSGKREPRSRTAALLWLAGAIVLYALALPAVTTGLGRLPYATRIIACFVLFFPAGILMGMPLPLGLSLLGKRDPDLIPWAWAVNGCCSVVSPILAMLIALSTGFTVVLLCGAGMYLIGAVLIGKMPDRTADDL